MATLWQASTQMHHTGTLALRRSILIAVALALTACSDSDAPSVDAASSDTATPAARRAAVAVPQTGGADGGTAPAAALPVIVRATGPSADRYRVGTQLDASGMITLAAGDRVVVVTPEGTRTLSGPGRFAVSAAPIAARGMFDTAAGVAQAAVDTDRQDAQAAAVRREIRPPAGGAATGPGRGAVLADRPTLTQGGAVQGRADAAPIVRPRAVGVRGEIATPTLVQPATAPPLPARPATTVPTPAPNTPIRPVITQPRAVRADPPRIVAPAIVPRPMAPVEAAPTATAPAAAPRVTPRVMAPPAATSAPVPRRAAPSIAVPADPQL